MHILYISDNDLEFLKKLTLQKFSRFGLDAFRKYFIK